MSIKLNKKNVNSDEIMPNSYQENNYVKVEEAEKRKLFANKKANKALIIAGVVFGVLLAAALIFVYVI